MVIRQVVLLLFSATIIISSSCRRNQYRVNISSVDADIDIRRLEKDLFTVNPDEIIDAVPLLKKRYGTFLQLFSYVINTGDINESSFGDLLTGFCTDRLNNEVYLHTMEVFPDLDNLTEDLQDAFRHYLYYFPGREIPAIYTCITGFNNSIITGDSVLAISLDRYLGADCEYYPWLNIYDYIAARMAPEYIVPDCMFGWCTSEWDISYMSYAKADLLTEMIHYGKMKYFQKCMLPDMADELIFGFSADQMNFCRNNEDQMWQYLVEHDLLFVTDQFTIRKLTGEAPFTTYFTNESPGRASVWLGFRIVESFMFNNPHTGMEELLNDTDIQGILEKARYNPGG